MNAFKVLSFIFLCLFSNNIYSQTGPGGVGNSTNNVLWLKSDSGTSTSTNGQPISSWNDASGNANNTSQANVSQQPLFINSVMNNYPSVLFDYSQTAGQNDFLWGTDAPNLDNTNGLTIFSVVRPTDLGSARAIISKRTNVGVNQSYMLFFFSSNQYYVDIDSNGDRFNTSMAFNANTNYIISTLYNGTLPKASRVNIYNGETLITTASETSSTIPDYASPFTIGATHIGDNRGFGGYISEVIVYRKALNAAERIIINNYLSAKYNQPLSTNDIYVQDDAVNGNFDHNVAGIGEANDGSNHTDSRGTGIVRISSPTDLNNNEFLFWGEETQNPIYDFSTNITNYTEQLNSRWRVNRQGNPGTVTVSFDISGMDLTGKLACSPLQLVVDDDYAFSSPTDVYNLTIAGNTATATGVQFQNNRYFTLRYLDQIVWDGTSFFNGSGTGNAPDMSDSCLKFTVKASGTLSFSAHVREVEVETGATLNIADGVLLETENQVVINGTLDLLGEAQLIQNHTGSSLNSGTGSLKIRQQGTTNLYNYNYLSSPVNRSGNWQIGYLEDAAGTLNFTTGINANPATSPITLSSRWLYGFNGSSGDYNSWAKLSTTTNLSPGIGFTMKGSGAGTPDQEYIFRGIPNDGDYNVTVNAGNDILTGNPYPSVLDANQFITDNLSVIDGSLYFWESFTTNNSHYLADYEGGYATYNLMMPLPAVADASGLTSGNGTPSKPAPTQYINIGQGFFTTITNSGTLTFNNAQRAFARESLGETIYYKTSNTKNKAAIDERPKVWFSFTSPKKYSKIIGLGYDSKNATYGYDKGYDAKSFDYLKNDFYWLLDDEPQVIQALPEINLQDDLPLGIKISDAGLYKFSISKMQNIPDNLNIYLLDKNENTYYNLKEGEAQLFLNTGTFNQFSIVFKKESSLGTTPFEDKSIFVTYNSNSKTLELHNNQSLVDIENFKIYNTIGQEIMNIENPTTNSINVSDIPNSVYFLKVISKNIKNSKTIKFVKY